jgi:formamidopyrimidine-DNA glycosylase
MPELPEVETMRRGILHLVGSRITGAEFPRGPRRPISTAPAPAAIVAAIRGGQLSAVERFGKRLALEVTFPTSQRWLVIEPRMTGLMLVVPPPTADHVRLVMHMRQAGERRRQPLVFWDQRGLGTLRLVDAHGLDRACGRTTLGPDGLVVTGDDLGRALAHSRRAIKVALLDQRAVAGIGNIYAAEILHRAGLDPRVACHRLSRQVWERLADTTRAVLAEAVRLEGSSIGDELYQTPVRRLGRFQHRHRVYGRAGQPCPTCHTPVRRIVQGQRSTFFCPQCQSRSGRRSP